jgi:hypothetical protein
MALWSALPSGEQVLTRVYYSYVEPIQIAWRKRPRMARVAIANLDGLAYGEIGLAPCSRHCIPVCAEIVEAHRVYPKGRIERAFGTLQDRMVKELRLAGISSIAAANAWLPGFITAYNTRFGRDPANAKDLHRPLAQADDLDEILAAGCWHR